MELRLLPLPCPSRYVDSPLDGAGHEFAPQDSCTRAIAGPANGCAPRANAIRTRRAQLKRDLKAGRMSIHELLLDAARLGRDRQGLRHAARRPEVRPGEGQQDPHTSAASRRARRSAASPSASAPSWSACSAASAAARGRVFVITGPSGVGKGTLIRGLRSGSPSSSCRCRQRHARRGRARRRRRLPLPLRRRVRRAARARATSSSTPSYSGRRYGTLRSELERRAASRRPGRARDRGPGRAPDPRDACPRRCRSSSPRRRSRRCATRLVGRGTDDPEEVERAPATAASELAAAATSSPTSWSTTGSSAAVAELERIVREPTWTRHARLRH